VNRKKRLLILGPSFRRNPSEELLPAIDRYDGLFYRVTRKYIRDNKDVDSVIMLGDLTLVNGITPIPYSAPEGDDWWTARKLSAEMITMAKAENEKFFRRKLRGGKYSEAFIAMGKAYAMALPDLAQSGLKVVFPTTGGPGPKAAALRDWISKK